jgi:uncharacterized protein HemY
MSKQWKPIKADLQIMGEDAKKLANCKTSEEAESLIKEHIRRKYNLPKDTEIDLSGIKIEAIKNR